MPVSGFGPQKLTVKRPLAIDGKECTETYVKMGKKLWRVERFFLSQLTPMLDVALKPLGPLRQIQINYSPVNRRLGFSTVIVLICSSVIPACLRAGIMLRKIFMKDQLAASRLASSGNLPPRPATQHMKSCDIMMRSA